MDMHYLTVENLTLNPCMNSAGRIEGYFVYTIADLGKRSIFLAYVSVDVDGTCGMAVSSDKKQAQVFPVEHRYANITEALAVLCQGCSPMPFAGGNIRALGTYASDYSMRT